MDATGMSLQQFLDSFNAKFGLTINMLSYGPAIVYSSFTNPKELKVRLPMALPAVCCKVGKVEISPKTRYMVLEAYVG